MLKIKKATVQEIPTLCNLLDILFSQEIEFVPNKELQERGLQTIIESDSLGEIFVASKDDTIIAMVNILYTYSTALGAKVALLEDMVVEPQYRGQEIGTMLISHVVEYLKDNGFKRLTLLTDGDNTQAHAFYEQNGFEVSTMVAYRKIL
jgi:GNAT superfamily N-acetyltransferase